MSEGGKYSETPYSEQIECTTAAIAQRKGDGHKRRVSTSQELTVVKCHRVVNNVQRAIAQWYRTRGPKDRS